MYPEALAYLSCPRHPESRLELAAGVKRAADGAIVRGKLRCPECAARYSIDDGIVDLLGPWAPPTTLAQLSNYLPITAWGYERLWRSRALSMLSGEPFGYARELPLIVGLSAPDRGGLFVDVGCSNGLYARALARARKDGPGHVIGIDQAMPMLRQARAFALAEGLRISYVCARAQALPFAGGSVAGQTMGGSLNEIGDAATALAELRRTLAPGGCCVMMGLIEAERAGSRMIQRVMRASGLSFWPLSGLNQRFAQAGLRLRAQWRYGVVVFSLLQAA